MVAQEHQAHRGFVVERLTPVLRRLSPVRRNHDGLFLAGERVLEVRLLHPPGERKRLVGPALGEVVVVHETVEPLIHPAVATLVAPHNHREPGVPEFVIGDAVEGDRVGPLVAEHDHRILHPALDAIDIDGDRVGIGYPLLGVVLDCGLRVLRRLFPRRLGRGRIEAHGQSTAAIDAHGIPDEMSRGRPGEVPHAVRGEMPGEGRVRRRGA